MGDAARRPRRRTRRRRLRRPGHDDRRPHPRCPPVVNDPDAIAVAERTVVRTLGAAAVEAAPQSWGGDDFAWYTQQVPGAYLRLGTHGPDMGTNLDLHAGHFDVDERAIGIGVQLLVGIVEDELRARGTLQP